MEYTVLALMEGIFCFTSVRMSLKVGCSFFASFSMTRFITSTLWGVRRYPLSLSTCASWDVSI